MSKEKPAKRPRFDVDGISDKGSVSCAHSALPAIPTTTTSTNDTLTVSPNKNRGADINNRITNLSILLLCPLPILAWVCLDRLSDGYISNCGQKGAEKGHVKVTANDRGCKLLCVPGKDKQRIKLPKRVILCQLKGASHDHGIRLQDQTNSGFTTYVHNHPNWDLSTVIDWPSEVQVFTKKPWDVKFTITHVFMFHYRRRADMETMLANLQLVKKEREQLGKKKSFLGAKNCTADVSHTCNENFQDKHVCVASSHIFVQNHKENLGRRYCNSLVEVQCPECQKWIKHPCSHSPPCEGQVRRLTQIELVEFFVNSQNEILQ